MDGLHLSCRLERRPGAARNARQHVAEACAGLDADVVATAQLLASELVTNALDHGRGPIAIEVVRGVDLRIEISDDSSAPPVVRAVDVENEHGRGMLIVETLAKAWGAGRSRAGLGKSVWFTLDTAVPAT